MADCNYDKKARMKQIQADINGLQAKNKQSTSNAPAGATYAEVFSSAINAAMRHKRAMVGNLSKKSDADWEAEMTFEEILAYERVTDDNIRPSAMSVLQPFPACNSNSSPLHPHPSRGCMGGDDAKSHGKSHSLIVVGRDSATTNQSTSNSGTLSRAETANCQGSTCPTDLFFSAPAHSAIPAATPCAIAPQSLGSMAEGVPGMAQDDQERCEKPTSSAEGVLPAGADGQRSSLGQIKNKSGTTGGFSKATKPTHIISYGYKALEEGLHEKHKEQELESSHAAEAAASPILTQHNRLLQSQEGLASSPRVSPGSWGRQCGLGTKAWTAECTSPGSRSRADHALLELWILDVADKDYGTYSRPCTAPSGTRAQNRYQSRTSTPQHTHNSRSLLKGTSPPRGHPPPRGASKPTHYAPVGSSPPANKDLHPSPSGPLPCKSPGLPREGAQMQGQGQEHHASALRHQQQAWAETSAGVDAAGGAKDGGPLTWPFANASTQPGGGLDVVEGDEDKWEGDEGGESEEQVQIKEEQQHRSRSRNSSPERPEKPGLYDMMRRAPHQITTATTPYLMGLPIEMLASMDQVPCLAGVVAGQIWHPHPEALNPAHHLGLREQAEVAVATHKKRMAQIKAAEAAKTAARAEAEAQRRALEVSRSRSMRKGNSTSFSSQPEGDGMNAEGAGGGLGETPLPDAGKEHASPLTSPSPAGKQKPPKGVKGKDKGKGLVRPRPSGTGLESQLGWDNVLRGVHGHDEAHAEEHLDARERAQRVLGERGAARPHRVQTAGVGSTSRGKSMNLFTLPPGSAKPRGVDPSSETAVCSTHRPLTKNTTWDRAQLSLEQERRREQQQGQDSAQQGNSTEPQIKSTYTPGLLTQNQQAHRQRQLAQQQYTERQQRQEQEMMKREQLQQQMWQQQLQQPCQAAGGDSKDHGQEPEKGLAPGAPTKVTPEQEKSVSASVQANQDHQERLQAARDRKQAREEKIRQGILHSTETRDHLPLLSKNLHLPPPSPSVCQIKMLDTLIPARKARKPTPEPGQAQDTKSK